MNKKQFVQWLNGLPEGEFDNYNIVFRTILKADNESLRVLDQSIVSCGIDIGTKEIYFCDEKSANIIND